MLGSWLATWAVFRMLTAVAAASGGDVVAMILVTCFASAVVAGIAGGMVAMMVSGLVRLATGKRLYFSISAPEGLKHLDPQSEVLVTPPIAIGVFAGFACWFFGFDPSAGLAAAIGFG